MQVIGTQEKVVVVGNSLGGYNSLAAAAQHPQLFRCGRGGRAGPIPRAPGQAGSRRAGLWEGRA